jgi:hypothetical protein
MILKSAEHFKYQEVWADDAWPADVYMVQAKRNGSVFQWFENKADYTSWGKAREYMCTRMGGSHPFAQSVEIELTMKKKGYEDILFGYVRKSELEQIRAKRDGQGGKKGMLKINEDLSDE